MNWSVFHKNLRWKGGGAELWITLYSASVDSGQVYYIINLTPQAFTINFSLVSFPFFQFEFFNLMFKYL